MRLPKYWLAVAAAGAINVIPVLPASASIPQIRFNQAIQLRLPKNADNNASSALLAVDCVGKGWCLAGGGYTGRHYTSFAMTATESGGHWQRAREIRLPAAAVQAAVTSVHCTSIRSCVAVGAYDTGAGSASFSVTETAGHWARPKIIAAPIGGGNPRSLAVSCVAPGSCEVVGSYQHGQDYQPITAAESHGRWAREHVLRLPPNGSVGQLNSVACWRREFCVAVGDYDFNTADFGVMAATESHGKWQRARAIRLPAGAQTLPSTPDLSSLTCVGVGSCTAVGTYEDAAGREAPMIAIETNGRWGRAQRVTTLPPNASQRRGATFDAVSCAEATGCLALGSYHTNSGRSETMFVTLGRRPSATELRLPPNGYAGGKFNSRLSLASAVDCTATRCVAVGAYKPKAGPFQAWMAMTP
jgi:hypothetical protein